MKYYFSIIVFFFSLNLFAQRENWTNLIGSRTIYDIALDGDYMWAASTGGLVKWNLKTNSAEKRYNFSNSLLPTNSILCVEVVSSNEIWVGTQKGLARLINGNWEVFNSSNSNLTDDAIWDLDKDIYGNIWIANGRKIVKYSNGGFIVYDAAASGYPQFVDVMKILAVSDGSVWFGFNGGSNTRFYDGTFTQFYQDIGMSWGWPIFQDKSGAIYFKGYKDLNNQRYIVKYDGVRFSAFFDAATGYPANDIEVGINDANGVLYLGGRDYIYKVNGNNWSLLINDVWPLCFAIQNNYDLYFGVYVDIFAGVMKYDGNSFTGGFDPSEVPLFWNEITKIEIDSKGRTWVGEGAHGYSLYDGQWHNANYRISTKAMTTGANDDFWVGTTSGLYWHPGNEYWGNSQKFTTSNSGLIDNSIRELCYVYNKLFILTNSGLCSFDGTNWLSYNKTGYSIGVSNNGVLWLGKQDGVELFTGTQWQEFNSSNSNLDGTKVIKIKPGNDEFSYFLTENGLYHHTGSDFQLITSIYGASDFEVISNGNIWFTSLYDGVINYSGGELKSFNKSTGDFPHNRFLAIKKDNNDKIWAGSAQEGIFVSKSDATDAEEFDNNIIPNELSLEQNYPNPFNPSTTISYQISESMNVSIIVYDVLGNEIKELVSAFQQPGSYQINFDAEGLSSGIYFYSLKTDNKLYSRKMLLLK